jgi:hypothetical protein
MDRPKQFPHYQHVGDKRTQVVYDIDALDDSAAEIVAELMESQAYICFGPDTVAEARNRGYDLYRG